MCTIIMVHNGTSSSYMSVDCVDCIALILISVFQAPLCLLSSWCSIHITNFFCLHHSFTELSLVGLALDVVD